MDMCNTLRPLGERITHARHRPDHNARMAVDCYRQATTTIDAIRLIELGARANLVCQLTGLERAVVKRLYRQLTGHPSPSGQAPFTDTWYRYSDQRLLQASIVWRLNQGLQHLKRRPARHLVDVYECYQNLVSEPLLSITRAAYVPQFVAMGTWRQRRCDTCVSFYVGPVTNIEAICPGCRRCRCYRCAYCGHPLHPAPVGRRAALCAPCRGDVPPSTKRH